MTTTSYSESLHKGKGLIRRKNKWGIQSRQDACSRFKSYIVLQELNAEFYRKFNFIASQAGRTGCPHCMHTEVDTVSPKTQLEVGGTQCIPHEVNTTQNAAPRNTAQHGLKQYRKLSDLRIQLININNKAWAWKKLLFNLCKKEMSFSRCMLCYQKQQ